MWGERGAYISPTSLLWQEIAHLNFISGAVVHYAIWKIQYLQTSTGVEVVSFKRSNFRVDKLEECLQNI